MRNDFVFQKKIFGGPGRLVGKAFLLSLFFCGVLLLAACGRTEAEAKPVDTYRASQTMLPDPGRDIEENEAYRTYEYSEFLSFPQEERVVRIGTLYSEEERKITSVIQILEPPYEEWQTYYLNAGRMINACRTTEENGDLLLLFYASYDGSDPRYYLNRWRDGEIISQKELALDIEEEDRVAGRLWQMDEQKKSTFRGDSTIYRYDEDFKLLEAELLPDELQGLIQETLAINPDGGYYLASDRALYRQGEEKLCTYANSGVWADRAVELSILQEEQLLLLAEAGGELCLIRFEPGEVSKLEQQEIVLAGSFNSYERRCVAEFNKRNPEYRIVLEEWDSEKEFYPEFLNRIQMEMSAGKGPDLLDSHGLDLEAYARQGFLEELDGLVEDESAYIGPALENCRIDGKLYCLPFSCRIHTMLAHRNVAGDKTSWTLEELQMTMEEQGVSVFFCGARGEDVVYFCSMMDEKAGFVDWEKGQANFDQAPFRQLLTFARDHRDTQSSLVSETEYEDMAAGKILAKSTSIDELSSFLYLRSHYPEGVFVGYPCGEGTGHYLEGRGYALNRNSVCKEGAMAFLKFLISEEGQRFAVEEEAIPVRLDAVERGLAEAEEKMVVVGLDDEKKREYIEDFRKFLAGCQPASRRYTKIIDIIFEETPDYFDGIKPMDEVVDIIQNRVQLYLNER